MHLATTRADSHVKRLFAGLFALVLGLGAFAPALADDDDDTRYRFNNINVDHGLSHNVVYAVRQDRYGFMWFGTQNGLNKYDGFSFTVYQNVPGDSTSISDNWITSILEDHSGTLWVGTRNGGLNRFDRATETFTRYPYFECPEEECDSPLALNSPDVTTIYEDRVGGMWIGTFRGLSKLNVSTGRFEHFRHTPGDARGLSSDKVWCVTGDDSGFIWVGTWDKGLNRLEAKSGSVVQFREGHVDGPHLTGDRIRTVIVDRDGDLWIGISGGGISRYEPKTGNFEAFLREPNNPRGLPHNTVWSLLQDSRGVIWAGTYDGGLSRFDRISRTFRNYRHDPDNPSSLASNVVSAIYEDRSGILWLAGEGGVSRYNTAQERHQHYMHKVGDPDSPSANEILTLHRSRSEAGMLWIGTHGGGLDRLDLATGKFTHFVGSGEAGKKLSSGIVTSVDEDPNGCVWVGTNDGLNCLNPATGRVDIYQSKSDDPTSLAHNHVFDVLVDTENRVWVGTDGGGLNRFERADKSFIRYLHDPFDPTSLSDGNVKTIFEDSRGNLWVGTIDGGLNLFEPETGTFKSYRHNPEDPTSISHNRILAIYEDPSGMLWVGTFAGLNRFDPGTGKFTRFAKHEGLPVEPYFAIAGDGQGGLWLTASGRLTHFDPRTGLIRHYSDRNGLSPNRYNSGALVVTRAGEVIVGGSNGFSRFRAPALEQEYVAHPPLVITAFKQMDQVVMREIFSDETITLSHNDRFFTLEFAVLDYTDPERHQYEFKLEGYDGEWQQMTGPIGRASYANFRPSEKEYIFKVRAANSHGAWNAMWVRVRVIPPWWATLWFQVSAILTFGVVAGSMLTYRVNHQKRLRAETLRLLTEGRERERQYLARELHDSPLQNLYSVRHKLEVISRTPADPENEKLLDDLHLIIDSTAEDLRILCGELRPPSLGPFGLEKAIRAHVRDVKKSHPDLNLTLELTPDGQALSEHLRHSLFRIYQSTMANVFRHAEAKNVAIRFQLFDGRVVLEITDDGKGFEVPKSWLTLGRSQHFGLLGISEWAEAIEADLQVDSAPGKGTTVRIVAPCPGHPEA